MISPLIKLIAKVDSLNRFTKGKIYRARIDEEFFSFVDDNEHASRIEQSKAKRYFHLCSCGTWSGDHSEWCIYLEEYKPCLKLATK